MGDARLTQRQFDLLRMRGNGASTSEMSRWLKISQSHVRELLRAADNSLGRPHAVEQRSAPARRLMVSQLNDDAMDL